MKNAEKNIRVVGIEGELIGYAANHKEAAEMYREYIANRG